MNKFFTSVAVATLFVSSSVFAYQVTGPVLSVDSNTITVKKGAEKWEIATGGNDTSSIKVGDKVTVEYNMTASKIEKKGTSKKK